MFESLNIRRLLLGLAVVAGFAFGPIAKAHAEIAAPVPIADSVAGSPLMWVLKDEDSTVYILGSIHIMKPGANWRTAKINEAFAASDELWLETADLDNAALMTSLIKTYGFDSSGRLATEGLTPEEVARIDRLLAPTGMTLKQLGTMRTWLVGTLLVQVVAAQSGFDASSGVDVTLLREGRAAGKAVKGFETAEQQIALVAGGSEAEAIEDLRVSLDDLEDGRAALDRLFSAWFSGDEEAIETEMIEAGMTPGAYQRLIVGRNADWVPQIEAIMAGKGTVFIAVGTAHLVGPDSVIESLAERGLIAGQVQP